MPCRSAPIDPAALRSEPLPLGAPPLRAHRFEPCQWPRLGSRTLPRRLEAFKHMFDSMLAPERTFDTMTAMSRTRVRPADLPDATSSRRVRSRRIALAIVVTAVAAAWAGPIARATTGAAEPVPVARSTYVVQRGDSLWA